MGTRYAVWGRGGIDQGSFDQMDVACRLESAVGAALMPDAHVGYGLPIGGVLALDGAVCPYAVGVDIACRMKLSVFPLEPLHLHNERGAFSGILETGTFFGVGSENPRSKGHAVFDRDWNISTVVYSNLVRAQKQLGTSGSGNHFVEWGILEVKDFNETLGLNAGQYVALMSHSGSRGTGAAVCNEYSSLAKKLNPGINNLEVLYLDTEAGQEYWAAMNLMGQYAAANHDVIHRTIAGLLGVQPITGVENHHNFAWEEEHNGRKVIVHRKGATPAGKGVLGVIPGSMGTPAYVVEGLGNPHSLNSASHGAGRLMSRSAAKKIFDYKTEVAKLAAQGVTVLSAGADEMVGVYKDIDAVMEAQSELVRPIAKFLPKIVKMSPGGRAED